MFDKENRTKAKINQGNKAKCLRGIRQNASEFFPSTKAKIENSPKSLGQKLEKSPKNKAKTK